MSGAQILAPRLAEIRPEVDLYLMAEIAVEDVAGRVSHHFRRVFHAREGALELHLTILAGVSERRYAVLRGSTYLSAETDRGVRMPVRIGLHAADATQRGEDFSGLGVHVAARIAALASGGRNLGIGGGPRRGGRSRRDR